MSFAFFGTFVSYLANLPDPSLEIFLFFLVFWVVLYVLTRVILFDMMQRHGISYRNQLEFIIRVVSLFHCAPTIILSLHMVLFQDLALFGVYKYQNFVASLSISFFTYDLIAFSIADYFVTLEHQRFLQACKARRKELSALEARSPLPIGGLIFVAHHLVGAIGQAIVVYYKNAPLLYAILLLTEFTTPFLNLMWFFEVMKFPVPLWNQVIFFLGWLIFRIYGCGYCAYILFANLFLVYETWPLFFFCAVIFFVVFLNGLNWWWLFRILRKIARNFQRTEKM